MIAPPVTLIIKFLWSVCNPLVLQWIKNFWTDRKKGTIISEIDELLKNANLTESQKATLRRKRLMVQMSVVDERISQLGSFIRSWQPNDKQ